MDLQYNFMIPQEYAIATKFCTALHINSFIKP